ncbi:hypothetical protein RFI_00841, partial [Reticulomyxa filosa]
NKIKNNNDQMYNRKSDEISSLRLRQSPIQEGFRSKDIDYNFQYLYVHHWIETVRSGVLCRRDLHLSTRRFNNMHVFSYESKFTVITTCYENIDWSAHRHNIDDVSEFTLDFIVSNGLHIINTLPFDCTFMKYNATSSIMLFISFGQSSRIWINVLLKLKALNTNKICITPALMNKETNSVARSDANKCYWTSLQSNINQIAKYKFSTITKLNKTIQKQIAAFLVFDLGMCFHHKISQHNQSPTITKPYLAICIGGIFEIGAALQHQLHGHINEIMSRIYQSMI